VIMGIAYSVLRKPKRRGASLPAALQKFREKLTYGWNACALRITV